MLISIIVLSICYISFSTFSFLYFVSGVAKKVEINDETEESDYRMFYEGISKRVDFVFLIEIIGLVVHCIFTSVIAVIEGTVILNFLAFFLAALLFMGLNFITYQRLFVELNKTLNNGLTKPTYTRTITTAIIRGLSISLIILNIMNYFIK